MLPVEMVDLKAQYQFLKTDIDAAMQKVMESGVYIKGSEVVGFEKSMSDFLKVDDVISCANGTDALQIAFMALNLPEGSEVITPAFSYAAVAEVLHLLKLKPVFTDVNPDTFLIDVDDAESRITPKTKAIVPVHLFGRVCNMDALLRLARNYNLYLVEDAAQSIGAVYTFADGSQKMAGTIGNIGTTSFFPSKNLNCFGDGGAVFTNDSSLGEIMRMIANHGQRVKYNHQIVGINSRLDEIQASVLNVHLPHLNIFNEKRRYAAKRYSEALNDTRFINCPASDEAGNHVFHQYTLTLHSAEHRDPLKQFLIDKGIPTMIYYPMPLHKQPAYQQNVNLEISEDLSSKVLSLPMHPWLQDEQIEYITKQIKIYFEK